MKHKLKPAKLFSSWFGVGFFPFAPGTWGSFFALPIIYFLMHWAGPAGLLFSCAFYFLLGLISIPKSTNSTTGHDPGFIVIDEVLGQTITFLPFSFFYTPYQHFIIFLIGFAFFRVFDIYKPFPVSYFDQKIKNAYGVLMDDVVAGIYASICLMGVYFCL